MRMIAVAVSLILVSVFSNNATADSKDTTVTIVYSGSSHGKLRACSCPGDPYGGLGERVTLINKLRSEHEPFLLVDTGNMISIYQDYQRKTQTIIGMMNLMRYDVAAIGRLDIYRGIDFTRTMDAWADFPLISTSLADTTTGEQLFMPVATKSFNGMKVAFIALHDSSVYYVPGSHSDDFKLIDNNKILSPLLDQLSEKTDYIVALSNMPQHKNEDLLADFDAIDIVIQGYGNERFETPLVTEHGIIVAPGQRGQFIGLLTVNHGKNGELELVEGELLPVLDIPMDDTAGEMIREYYRSIR